jgi:3-dehydroquinate dehydratase
MIINGSYLNHLGIREPDIYGHATLKALESEC